MAASSTGITRVAPNGSAESGGDHECTTSTVAWRSTPSARAQRRAAAACSESSMPTTMRPAVVLAVALGRERRVGCGAHGIGAHHREVYPRSFPLRIPGCPFDKN